MPSSTGTLVFNDQKIQAPDMYVTESLGVGVSDPTSNLEVVGNAYVSSNLEVGTANLFVDTTTGRVGVGTGSPDSLGKLHVNGNVYVGNGNYLMSGYASTGDDQYFGKEYSGRIIAGMEIENTTLNGNYSQKLHLRTHHYGTSEARRFTIDESGNVGINTTTPQYRLDVNGVARLNNVAFAAYRDQTTKDSSYTSTVVFNNEYFDQSGNYDTGTGLFTAPVAGIYHFSFNAYTNYAGDTQSRLYIYKNNGIYTQKGDEIDQHGNGIDVTIKLAVNDTVSLRGSGSYPVYLYASSAHNIFCGHLLTAV
jgi:hypothetical protein